MRTTGTTTWRRLRRVLVLAVVVGFTVPAILWLMFQHKPGWYRPVVLDEAGLHRARNEATTTVDYVSDRMVRGEAFDLTLEALAVNEWLFGLEGLWPDAREAIPPELSELATGFEAGQVRLGALCVGEGVQVILNAAFSVRVSGNGRDIEIALAGVRGGSLPLPRAALDELLGPLLSEARGSGRQDAGSPLDSVLRDVRSVDDLREGVKIPNRFVWPNGDRPFRIESVEIERGRVRLRIEPL